MSVWDRNEDLISLRDAMNELMRESFVPGRVTRRGGTQSEALRLPLDVYATSEELVVMASLPGLTPDDVEILLEGDTLTIRGELLSPLENVDYILQERPCGCPFSRTLLLNVPVDVEKAEAKFEEGVLTLILPKAEAVRPKVIKVQGESK